MSGLAPNARKQLARLNFDSAFYDDLMDGCFGADIRHKARTLLQTPEYQEKLTRGFMTGDVESDRLVVEMQKDSKVRADYELAVANGIDAVADPCQELIDFMDHAVNIPALFNRDMIELGAHIFLTKFNPVTFFAYGWPCILLQGPSVGITAAANYTNQPPTPMTILDSVKRPETHRRLMARFAETFKWFAAVAQPGASQPYTTAFVENCRIRIIHSHIRLALGRQLNQERWRFDPPIGWMVDELGTPLSAADGSIVVTTLAIAIMVARRQLGQQVSDHELEALFQFTSFLNYMQGVPADFIFPSSEETILFFCTIIMSMDPNCRRESIEGLFYLSQNLGMGELFFKDARALNALLDGLVQASFQEMYGKRFMAFYNMQEATPLAKALFRSTRFVFRGINYASRFSPKLSALLDQSGLALWNDIIPRAEGKIKQLHAGVAAGTSLVDAH